ncbi:hypothetical protein [Pseudomonas atagonensis]|uniref:hypothetical protein n=1 Tax=Pseudomonas atagonensis TaxID=2609964 RepID=UPI0015B5252F|nr:hypothetical protein [Pseudomonas atagonensis]
MTVTQGHFARMTEPVTEADSVKKYGSDEHLIRFGHVAVFSSALKVSIRAL